MIRRCGDAAVWSVNPAALRPRVFPAPHLLFQIPFIRVHPPLIKPPVQNFLRVKIPALSFAEKILETIHGIAVAQVQLA